MFDQSNCQFQTWTGFNEYIYKCMYVPYIKQ